MKRAILFVLMFASLGVPSLQAQDKTKSGPMVTVRLKSLDGIVGDLRYLAEKANRGEEAKQAEGFFRSFTGEKGLEGIDTKKPFGLYGNLGAQGFDSQVVFLIPIADQKTFDATLTRLGVEGEKDKDGIHSIQPAQSPFPILYRYANDYVYITPQLTEDALELMREKNLLKPGAVFAADDASTFSYRLDLSKTPREIRELVDTQIALAMADLKEDGPPRETEAQKAFRLAVLDHAAASLKDFMDGAGVLEAQWTVDQKKDEVNASVSLSATADSKLLKTFQGLAKQNSSAAGLIGEGSAMSFTVNVEAPDEVRKHLGPVLEEALGELKKRIDDPTAAKHAGKLLDALMPTLKDAHLDLAADYSGPTKEGLYTFVAGARVKDGSAIEKAVKDAIKEAPEEVTQIVTVDAAKAGDYNIHRLNVGPFLDERTKKILGENPVYFAVRNNALFVSLGAEGMSAIKTALESKGTTVPPMRGVVSVARIAQLIGLEQPGAVEIARKVFSTGDKGSKMSLTLDGGDKISLQFRMDTDLIRFAAEMEEAQRDQ